VLLAALILFLPPSMLLGTVSPILVKLVFTNAAHVGRTTGTLYAIGSLGNVMGILVADYLLLVYFSLNANILSMGVILGALGLAHLAIRLPAASPAAPGAPAAAAGGAPV
jgi:hypothetical protein